MEISHLDLQNGIGEKSEKKYNIEILKGLSVKFQGTLHTIMQLPDAQRYP